VLTAPGLGRRACAAPSELPGGRDNSTRDKQTQQQDNPYLRDTLIHQS
jgi:hypothetical protein